LWISACSGAGVGFQTDCDVVRPHGVLSGKAYLSDSDFRFVATSGHSAAEVSSDLHGDWSAAIAKDLSISWPLASIKQMHRRRYLMRHTALELYSHKGDQLLLNFADKTQRSRVRRCLKKKCNLEYRDRDHGRMAFKTMLHDLQEEWHRRELTNFDYLMRLNELAGRTYNDLNQYPVFPWVLRDYTSETLDLSDPAVYRDLSLPMGAQEPEQRELVCRMYEEFTDDSIKKFHYGSHYSTMGFVLYYLMRVEPFSSYHKGLQSGRFDHADRLFHSIERTYYSCTHSTSDVKELLPEFFYLPDVLLNRNHLPLGTRQDGQSVGDVLLPPWASDATDFIAKHRAALESEYVSAHLHLWIDLIFGFRQRGKAAEEATNVFFYLTYEGNVDLSALKDPQEVARLKAQINNFGQMPQQLLLQPHPARRSAPPPISPTAMPGSTPCSPVSDLALDGVPLALLPLEEVLLVFDARRLISSHRMEIHRARSTTDGAPQRLTPIRAISATYAVLAGGEQQRVPAFSPELPLPRAICLISNDPRGRDALLVSGAHWDASVCISLAHGSGGTRQRLLCHSELVTSVAVSSCGRWLISGSMDATAMLWHTSSKVGGMQNVSKYPTHVLRGHSDAVLCVAISSVMRLAASGSRDGTVALHTLRDGLRVRVLKEPNGASVEQLLLADSGHVIFSGTAGSRLHVFSINGLHLWSWASADAGLSALGLTPCGAGLVCGFDDGQLTVWRLFDRAPIVAYEPAPSPVVCLAVTETHLLVGTSRAELLMYLPPPRCTEVASNGRISGRVRSPTAW